MNAHRPIIPYDPGLKQLARKLRNHSTVSEVLLWNGLKRKQMKGYDFNRQKPLFRYIVDFFCIELLLAVEIDGTSHECKSDEDEDRQKELEKFGISFLRFHDLDVKRDVNGVLSAIERWIEKYELKHTPNPSQEGIGRFRDTSEESGIHTPDPSQEGNRRFPDISEESGKHTPNPSQEGNN